MCSSPGLETSGVGVVGICVCLGIYGLECRRSRHMHRCVGSMRRDIYT